MEYKTLWTNYKIYGIIIGMALGVIVYNMIPIDFSISHADSIKNKDLFEIYIFQTIILFRFLICIWIISFLKIKNKLFTVILGVEGFKISGVVVTLVKLHRIIFFSGLIETILKIIVVYLFFNNVRPVLNKIIAILIVLLGSIVGIFFISFF